MVALFRLLILGLVEGLFFGIFDEFLFLVIFFFGELRRWNSVDILVFFEKCIRIEFVFGVFNLFFVLEFLLSLGRRVDLEECFCILECVLFIVFFWDIVVIDVLVFFLLLFLLFVFCVGLLFWFCECLLRLFLFFLLSFGFRLEGFDFFFVWFNFFMYFFRVFL